MLQTQVILFCSLKLILELGPYIEELKKTGGAIKEFVNPKYFFSPSLIVNEIQV